MPDLGVGRSENGPSVVDGFDDEVDLVHFARGLWRRRWLIVAATIVGAVVAVLVAVGRTPAYESTSKVLVPSLELGPGMQLTGSAFAAIVKGPTLASAVLKEFQLDRPPHSLTTDEFRWNRLTVSAMPNTNIATITVRLGDPGLAARVADRFAELSVSTVKQMCDNSTVKRYETTQALLETLRQRLDDTERRLAAIASGAGQNASTGERRPDREILAMEIEALQAGFSYLDLTVRMDEISIRPVLNLSQMRVFDRASTPDRPVGSSTLGMTVAGGVAGYLVALVGVLFFDALRLTVLRRRP